MSNQYSTMVSRLNSELAAGLAASYAGLIVRSEVFRPARLPVFTRYCIVISPAQQPWAERRVAAREVQYLFRADLYLLCKNWDESDSLFGVTAGAKGLFEMIEDVKNLLRQSTLSGLLDKTYDEAGGDGQRLGPGGVEFGEVIVPGFDAGEYAFVQRARIPYLGRMIPFCHLP